MAGGESIDQKPDIGRQPIAGDLFLMETAAGGGTKRMDFSRLKAMFQLKKLPIFRAAGGETEIDVPGLQTGTFSVLFRGLEPMEEYFGSGAVPSGMYKADYALQKIYFGDALGIGDAILVIFY